MSTRRSKFTTKKAAGLALALGALVGMYGVATATSPDEPTMPASQDFGDSNSYGNEVRQPGPGYSNEEAIRGVLDRMSGEGIIAIEEIGGDEYATNSDVPRLRIGMEGEPAPGTSPEEFEWVGALAAGAVLELVHTDQTSATRVFDDFEVTLRDRTGEVSTVGGGIGDAATGMVFPEQSDDAIRDHATKVLDDFGLTPVSIDVLHPLGPAVRIVASIPEEAKVDWVLYDLAKALDGIPPTIEGRYIEVRSPAGEPLFKSAVAYRVGLGSLWYAPKMDERFGLF